jgi:signal transduction histidine kinase
MWRAVRGRGAAPAALVLLGMVAFAVAVYIVVVGGGGALIGQTDSPHTALSVLATAIVAIGFEPVRARLRPLAVRLAHSDPASPYEVLTRFLAQVTATYATDEVPARMARLLAEGTGAAYAQVWLSVHDRLVLAATWPPEAPADQTAPADTPGPADSARAAAGRRTRAVYHGGERLAVLVVQERDRAPLTPVEEKLFAGLAAQAGLVLRTVRLRAELADRLRESSRHAEELQISRERIVTAQDEERRRLERDIHDGAQQHLVALAVNLRLAQTLLARAPERAPPVLAGLETAADDTIATLSALSRGVYPRLLTDAGLPAALHAAAAMSSAPVDVETQAELAERPPADIEAAVYFCCLEALQNAAKHSGATRIAVRLERRAGTLQLTVDDDGAGFAAGTGSDDAGGLQAQRGGSGLTNMRDRIESVGGVLVIDSQAGVGTRVTARVPVPVPAAPSAPPAPAVLDGA